MASWSVGPYEITPRQDVRVGTAERERAAAKLAEHFTAGRLEMDEFDDRVKAAYSARTQKDLSVLLGDLPGPRPGPGRRSRGRLLPVLVLLAALGIFLTFVAFPPLVLIPVVFLVLRVRRRRQYQLASATEWRPGRRACARWSNSGW